MTHVAVIARRLVAEARRRRAIGLVEAAE